ncbi:MAG: YetF domain-containing protein [Gemmatimonadota bacterium]
MFFNSWFDLLRVLLVGTAAYVALVGMLRVSGKRTLAKMNAFDLVVTVALGSTLATVLLSKEVALAEGLLAFATLIALQFGVAWLSVRSRRVQELVKSEPALLFFEGRYLDGALRRERVAREEVRSAIRAGGIASLEDVAAVVLETDGTFSVVRADGGGRGSLADLDTPAA